MNIKTMTRNNIKQALQLSKAIDGGNAYTTADLYMKLLKLSRKLSRLDTAECNGELAGGKYEKAIERVYKELDGIKAEYKLSYYHLLLLIP